MYKSFRGELPHAVEPRAVPAAALLPAPLPLLLPGGPHSLLHTPPPASLHPPHPSPVRKIIQYSDVHILHVYCISFPV